MTVLLDRYPRQAQDCQQEPLKVATCFICCRFPTFLLGSSPCGLPLHRAILALLFDGRMRRTRGRGRLVRHCRWKPDKERSPLQPAGRVPSRLAQMPPTEVVLRRYGPWTIWRLAGRSDSTTILDRQPSGVAQSHRRWVRWICRPHSAAAPTRSAA